MHAFPHSVFIAPVTAAGFHAAGENGKLFYKYGSAGMRIGFFRFSRYGEKVPELRSHIDVTAGKWENLSGFRSGHPYTPTRLQVEAQFSIPVTPLYVGFRKTAGVAPNDGAIMLGIRINFARPLSLILPLDR